MIGNKLFSGYKILPAILVVLTIVAGGLFIFSGQDNKEKKSSSSDKGSSADNQLMIPDLGVAITLPNELMGTITERAEADVPEAIKHKTPTIVNFQLESYTSLVNKCLGTEKSSAPYASLAKISGQAPEDNKQVLRQFNDFYVSRLANGVNVTCKDESDQSELNGLSKKLNDSLDKSFSSAREI